MIIEGKNVVFEALTNGVTINKMFVLESLSDAESNKIISLAKSKGVRIDFVSKNILESKSVLKRHQGFVCETVDFEYSDVEELFGEAQKRGDVPFFVILDGIEDPHNFGAIIRSCECAGVQGIIIPKHRSVCVNETVIKTSAGAIAGVKIARVTNLNSCIDTLKQKGIWVYGLEGSGESIYRTNLKGPIALVVGSEGDGISRLTKEKCDAIVSMPLKGTVNSLNASCALSVALYETLRQRGV
ncbi:MAG: 23S rRNA (guanosine(2251)-2'-O)-methyltransferase RlmB [Clostridia bacterium]